MGHPSCEKRCVLAVSGPVAHSVAHAISERFDAHLTRAGDSTVLIVGAVDQAAVRAVMIMLWDSGHEVVAMSIRPADRPRGIPCSGDVSDQAEFPGRGDRLLP